MRSRFLVALFASVLALATTSIAATSQAQWVSERARPSRGDFRVDGFAPADARPGDRVVIHGAGFRRWTTRVLVGGQRVALEAITPESIVFVVPAEIGDGEVMVVHPRAGSFLAGVLRTERGERIVVDHVLVEPRRQGVRVTVLGRGFAPEDVLMVDGVPATIRHHEPDRIVGRVPEGVWGAVWIHRGRDGRRIETGVVVPRPGTVVPPTPPPVAIGTLRFERLAWGRLDLVIAGTGFGPDARVTIGGLDAPLVSQSDTQLVVRVPRRLAGTQTVVVETRGLRLLAPQQVVIPRR